MKIPPIPFTQQIKLDSWGVISICSFKKNLRFEAWESYTSNLLHFKYLEYQGSLFLRPMKFIQGHGTYWKFLEATVMVPINLPGANTDPELEFLGKHRGPFVGAASGQGSTQQSGAASDPLETESAPQSGFHRAVIEPLDKSVIDTYVVCSVTHDMTGRRKSDRSAGRENQRPPQAGTAFGRRAAVGGGRRPSS